MNKCTYAISHVHMPWILSRTVHTPDTKREKFK